MTCSICGPNFVGKCPHAPAKASGEKKYSTADAERELDRAYSPAPAQERHFGEDLNELGEILREETSELVKDAKVFMWASKDVAAQKPESLRAALAEARLLVSRLVASTPMESESRNKAESAPSGSEFKAPARRDVAESSGTTYAPARERREWWLGAKEKGRWLLPFSRSPSTNQCAMNSLIEVVHVREAFPGDLVLSAEDAKVVRLNLDTAVRGLAAKGIGNAALNEALDVLNRKGRG